MDSERPYLDYELLWSVIHIFCCIPLSLLHLLWDILRESYKSKLTWNRVISVSDNCSNERMSTFLASVPQIPGLVTMPQVSGLVYKIQMELWCCADFALLPGQVNAVCCQELWMLHADWSWVAAYQWKVQLVARSCGCSMLPGTVDVACWLELLVAAYQ